MVPNRSRALERALFFAERLKEQQLARARLQAAAPMWAEALIRADNRRPVLSGVDMGQVIESAWEDSAWANRFWSGCPIKLPL